jgi:hypothetical protein
MDDLTEAESLLNTLVAEIPPLARREATARAALEAEEAKQVAKDAAAAEVALTADDDGSVAAVLAAAEQARDSATAQLDFHTRRLAWAQQAEGPLKTINDAAFDAKTAVDAEVEDAKLRLSAAGAACKKAAFEAAQQALTARQAAATANQELAAQVASEYAETSARPTDGTAGTLCHYEQVTEDNPNPSRVAECQKPEPDSQETPLCCGAAQTFLKDGTKLTVESC